LTGKLVLAGAPQVEVTLRRSRRARRLSLRISRLDGRVTMTLPLRVPLREAQAFLNERGEWLRRHLDERPEPIRVGPGVALPVQGRALLIVPGAVRRAVEAEGRLLVDPDRAAGQALAHVKAVARRVLAERCQFHAQALGRSYTRIVLRDTRSRWGSCSSTGTLSFSWRLALAPARVLDYVAAHEVAHLAEMNHGPQFWAHVARLCPDYETHRRWLHEHGTRLHRYRFEGDEA